MNSTIRSLSIAAVAALLASGCGGKSDPPSGGAAAGTEEKVLNVYNWSDYIDPEVIRDFTRETGITVHYDVFDANEVLETKLLTGNSGYDVVVPSAYFLERQVKAGVFATLDKSKLPGLANLDPELTARAERHDPGGAHSRASGGRRSRYRPTPAPPRGRAGSAAAGRPRHSRPCGRAPHRTPRAW